VITRTGWLALAAGALAVTLLVTWPLARCLDRCLGEPPDTLLSVYFLAWVAHAVVTPGVRLLDATLFAPYPGTLALGEYMPGYAVVSIPVIGLTGNPVLAHNVLLILSHAAAAVGAVALAARLTGSLTAALIAGAAFAWAPRLLDQAYNVQTLAVFWFPWLCLALERFAERPTWWRAGLAAGLWLALALSCLNLFVYGSLLAGVLVLAGVTLGQRPVTRLHVVRLGIVGGLAVALVLAFLSPNRALAREWGLGRTLEEVGAYSATLRDYLAPPREDLLRRLLGAAGDLGHERVGPGLVTVALALVGLLALARDAALRRRYAPYVVVLATAIVLSFGPALATPWGALPLPYRLLYSLVPGFHAIRTPARFLVFVELGLALVAAAGAAWWLARASHPARRLRVAILVTAIVAESALIPYPGAVPRLDPASVPEVYRWLGRQPPSTRALGVPMGDWVNIAAAAFHLRPTLNGWSSYEPPHYAALAEAMERFPDRRSVALVQGAGVDVVLVDRAWLTPARVTALGEFRSALRPERAFATHLVFRVARDGAGPGPAALRAAARDRPDGLCVSLENPGPGWVVLYPLHRLRLAAGERHTARWLPLDVPPAAVVEACLPGARAPGPLPLDGAIEAPGRVYRFTVTPGGPPAPLAAADSS
jgi:hypothetical protein